MSNLKPKQFKCVGQMPDKGNMSYVPLYIDNKGEAHHYVDKNGSNVVFESQKSCEKFLKKKKQKNRYYVRVRAVFDIYTHQNFNPLFELINKNV